MQLVRNLPRSTEVRAANENAERGAPAPLQQIVSYESGIVDELGFVPLPSTPPQWGGFPPHLKPIRDPLPRAWFRAENPRNGLDEFALVFYLQLHTDITFDITVTWVPELDLRGDHA